MPLEIEFIGRERGEKDLLPAAEAINPGRQSGGWQREWQISADHRRLQNLGEADDTKSIGLPWETACPLAGAAWVNFE
jgi:hypothetical protein